MADDGTRARWASLDEIGEPVQRAIQAAEDGRFPRHPGVDPLAIARALGQLIIHRRVVSGASTLTQQLARTLVRRPRTWGGKFLEAALALRIERALDKRAILEQYLNRVSFGPGVRGVEAASRFYFDKPARDLSLAEAAALAGIPRGPSLYDPRKGTARLKRRRDRVLARMLAAGLAGREEVERALAGAHRGGRPRGQPGRAAPRAGGDARGAGRRHDPDARPDEGADADPRPEPPAGGGGAGAGHGESAGQAQGERGGGGGDRQRERGPARLRGVARHRGRRAPRPERRASWRSASRGRRSSPSSTSWRWSGSASRRPPCSRTWSSSSPRRTATTGPTTTTAASTARCSCARRWPTRTTSPRCGRWRRSARRGPSRASRRSASPRSTGRRSTTAQPWRSATARSASSTSPTPTPRSPAAGCGGRCGR